MMRVLRRGTLARDTAWMTASFGLRLLLQAGYFFVLARALGATEYGTFVGVVAVIGILAPLGSLGVGHILVRDTARLPDSLPVILGDTLLVAAVGATILSALVLLLSPAILPSAVPLGLLGVVLISDFTGVQLSEICAQAFQASARVHYSAALQLGPVALRLVAVLVVNAILEDPSATEWLLAYATAGILSAIVVLSVTIFLIRPRAPVGSRAFRRAKESWQFSVMASSQVANNDADKSILARHGLFEAAGTYSAAYRLIDVALAPVLSLMYSAYARFFSAGADGASQSRRFAMRIAAYSTPYALLAAFVLWISAPLLPLMLGESFRPSVEALRWLTPLIPARALKVAGADALAGAGFYSLRMSTTLVVVAFNVGLNVLLIPLYSWRAAVAVSLLCDLSLAAAFWLMLSVLSRRKASPACLAKLPNAN